MAKSKSRGSKSILVVSDMHVGASTAICTKAPKIVDQGTTHKPNRLQKELLSVWKECIGELEHKPDLLVVNGEPCDGGNPKSNGQQTWSTNIEDQLNDARKLLEMIPYKKIMFTRGSGYHVTERATNFEEILAGKMGAVPYSAYGGEGKTDYYALVKMNGVNFNFTHHVGFSKQVASRPGSIAREMSGMKLDANKMGKTDVIVRSHVHYYVHVEYPGYHGFTTPTWKYPDGHLFKGGTAGTTPDIGMVEVIVESNGKINVLPHIASMTIRPTIKNI